MSKRNLLLSVASGLILALALPKPGLWPAAWVGLVPLFLAIGRTPVFRELVPETPGLLSAALCGLVAGAVFFGIVLFWISIFGYLPWVLVALMQAAFVAIFAGIASRVMPNRIGRLGYITVPAAWIAMQWARSLGTYGFTWGSLAHTQADVAPVIQIASITGPWGVDFLICLFSLAVAGALLCGGKGEAFGRGAVRPARRAAPNASPLLAVLAAGMLWVPGWIMLARSPHYKPAVKVAIIQASLTHEVNPSIDYTVDAFMVHRRMSLEAAKSKPDFVVWPETTLPAVISDGGLGGFIRQLVAATHANYVVGGYDAAENPGIFESYNSAHFYGRDGGKLGVYHKAHLVPFGEFVPLRDKLPFLQNYGIRDVDVLPGKSHRLIRTEIGPVGVSICFESLFPQISRLEVARGATALFVITNDAWFERTQAARQHEMMAKLRAVENRRYIVRAAATGISAIIDPYGGAQTELGIFKRGIVSGSITPLTSKTFYTRFGDYLAYLCAAITVFVPFVRALGIRVFHERTQA